nr:AMP-binding protein [Sphingomonas sp. CDS-1]
MTETIGKALAETTRLFPDRIFLTDGNSRISFSEASAQIDRICGALLALGFRRHDRLALWLPNSPAWVMLALACARLGILLVTVNTRNKGEETAYILAKSRARGLIAVDRFWDIDYRAMLAEMAAPHLEHVLWLDGGADGFRLRPWAESFAQTPETLRHAEAAVTASDPALAVFTSGTTGFPKGVVHSHVLLDNVRNFAGMMHFEPGDVILGHMPFYHIAGLVTALLPAVTLGCTLVTVAHWQAETAARLIAREKIAIFGGIPTHFIDLADKVAELGLDTSCLKCAWIGGASIAPDVARRAKHVLGLDALAAAYGMTETSACTTLSRFDDPLEIAAEGKGVPIGDFEVKVADPETGAACPVGNNGEIWVRGSIVMQGYLEDPEETAKVMTGDGWFRTGDLGQFDATGYLKITGRLKEMFIVGGSNVYPAEVERCLHQVPGVRQAVVVGVPDRRLGEVGFAFVERDESAAVTQDVILAFAKAHIADYKVPRHLRFVEAFPMTGTRKIQRHLLVAQARDLLGYQES